MLPVMLESHDSAIEFRRLVRRVIGQVLLHGLIARREVLRLINRRIVGSGGFLLGLRFRVCSVGGGRLVWDRRLGGGLVGLVCFVFCCEGRGGGVGLRWTFEGRDLRGDDFDF